MSKGDTEEPASHQGRLGVRRVPVGSANPCPSQESEKDRPTPDGSGLSFIESFAYYDPASSSLKTSQVCLDLGGPMSSVILPPAGMMRNGILFQRRSLEPSISVKESGYWPTPRASDWRRLNFKVATLKKVVLKKQNNGNNFSLSIVELIKLMSAGETIKTSFVEMMMGFPTNWTDLKL